MKTTNKIHYVYKITNLNPTDERLYYIGVRSTSKASAILDTNYRSSSNSLKEVIKEIGYDNFEKEILSTWKTRKLAVQEEIRLHNFFDVAKNTLFYNKAKQTSTGFDTTGNILSNEHKLKISNKLRNRVPSKSQIDNQVKTINSTDWKNTVGLERKENFINTVNSKEWKSTIGVAKIIKYKDTTSDLLWKETIGMSAILKTRETKSSSKWKETVGAEAVLKYKETVSNQKWKETVGVLMSKKMSEAKKGVFNGSSNPAAKHINIVNAKGIIMYNTFGNFKQTCEEKRLPFSALSQSIKLSGKPIYATDISKNRANKNGNFEYIGWSAKIV